MLIIRSDTADADRPLWFCVDGDRLVLRDLASTSPSDPVFFLTRP